MPEQKQFTIDYGWATETFIATQAEYDKKISDYETEKSERHSRNQYTIYEAAEVLASSNEIGGAKYFLNERMRKAVEAGYLQVSDPKDGGPLTRRCRPGSDWVTPLAIDKWLEHDGYQFRWPDPATPASVVAVSDASQPLPLTTLDIANCFDGLHWNESKWKTNLGKKPKWLAEHCIAIAGAQGRNEIHWYPVCIGAALVKKKRVKPQSIRARFQKNPLLAEWRDAWKNYESQYLTTE